MYRIYLQRIQHQKQHYSLPLIADLLVWEKKCMKTYKVDQMMMVTITNSKAIKTKKMIAKPRMEQDATLT